ncbi:hypothetical protein [Microvirga sp. TS319]|uniref:hypothetical protein n=1 Tax=Microvirga sp. TS319 TaxID=3241165 RepID=UPI00351A918F
MRKPIISRINSLPIIASAFIVYCFLMIAVIAFVEVDPETRYELIVTGEATNSLLQLIAVAIVFGAFLIATAKRVFGPALRREFLIYLSIGVLAVTAGLGGIGNDGFFMQNVQLVMTLGFFMMARVFWLLPSENVARCLRLISWALYGLLVGIVLVRGLPDSRWYGMLQPNHFGRYAFVALGLHTLSRKRISPPFAALAVAFCLLVSARTVLGGVVAFTAMCLFFPSMVRGIVFAVAGAMVGFVLLGSAVVFDFINADVLLDVFELTSDERGFGSGFTGRADVWASFLSQIDGFIFYGLGFRSQRYIDVVVHSGILSYFLDFGLIPGLIILLVVIARSLWLLYNGRAYGDSQGWVAGAFCITTLLIQCLEPDNLNIGFLGSLVFLLVLAYQVPCRDALPPQTFDSAGRRSIVGKSRWLGRCAFGSRFERLRY